MRVHIATTLPCSPDRAWAEVLTSRLLLHVCWPLATFRPLEPPTFPAAWGEGRYHVRMRALGVPFGTQWIVITKPATSEPETRIVRDNGHGDVIRRWDHWIRIRPAAGGATSYTDTIDIEAGWLTPLVWLYASLFYRWRQARWRRLAARDFRYGAAPRHP